MSFGIDLRKLVTSIAELPSYIKDYFVFKRHAPDNSDFHITKLNFQLSDKFQNSGDATGHYFHQDLLVASKIFLHNPEKHIDVGSRIDGFAAHVACFRQVNVIDIRDLKSSTANIKYLQADMMSDLPKDMVESCDSLSCLHALEHFGLGRYGDPVRWNGHLLGFENLYKMLRKGGRMYLSVPIGKQRIEFNAHRVFSIDYLMNLYKGRLGIISFAYIDDSGNLFTDVKLLDENIINNCGCSFGCGIFELLKL